MLISNLYTKTDDTGVRNTYWYKNDDDHYHADPITLDKDVYDDQHLNYGNKKEYDDREKTDSDANAVANAAANAVANANVILKLILGDGEIPKYGMHQGYKPMGADEDTKNTYSSLTSSDGAANADANAIAMANANANVQVIFIHREDQDEADDDKMNTFNYWYEKYLEPKSDNTKNAYENKRKYDNDADINVVANAEANAIANAKANVILVLVLGDNGEIPEYKVYQSKQGTGDYGQNKDKDKKADYASSTSSD